MKTFIPLFFYFISIPILCSAQLKSYVDERMELTGIVWRLAEAEEYVNDEVMNYVADIDDYFAPYKSHPLIRYVKEIRERDLVAYNAVSGTIEFLEIKNGQIKLSPHADLNCLTEDPRWTKETFLTYIKLLNRFYKDSRFRAFFNKHKVLYAETEKRFDNFLYNIHAEWFDNFFGQSLEAPLIYVSLTNGTSNYGGAAPCLDNILPYGSIIIGCSIVDSKGIPIFDEEINYGLLYTIIHELCHIHTEPIISQYQQDMKQAADIIFPYVKEALEKVAYGDAPTMISEGLNNLCANMYFRKYPTGMESYDVLHNEQYGFIWMRRAVKFMDNFNANRHVYSHIKDFMPQIVSFINSCADNIEQIVFEYNHSNPYVINIFPGTNTTVSSDIKEVRVDFSHSMHNARGTFPCKDTTAIHPNIGDEFWSEDKKTLIIPVKLEQGRKYGFTLPAYVFQSEERFPMKKNVEILFQTEE
ncbi:MAG: DUF4932 domain-containing protein [Dysgonamonadaceae bacterium]|jgi:hypothetical protein|nr:DUF4932 domain-containing protein [Dysgonamonadaceae bacterium]